jgi:hypothetical protein
VIPLVVALTVCDPAVGGVAAEDPLASCAEQVRFPFQPIAARELHATPGEPRDSTKREVWLRDKMVRPDVHVTEKALLAAAKREEARERARKPDKDKKPTEMAGPGARIRPITTLFNVWTREALPIVPGKPAEGGLHRFLRDHYTNQATQMDTRLLNVLTQAARKFKAQRIEVVSGYRSPKYNLMLRKKGHQVARSSQHVEGNAVDFRIRGVPTRTLLNFVKSLRLGGVGYYPNSQFVHSDTGKIRYWKGS